MSMVDHLLIVHAKFHSYSLKLLLFLFSLKEWIPALKEHCLTVKTSLEPHVHSLTTKTLEVYESSKTALIPHLIKAQEVVDPYYQVDKI